MVKYYGKYPKGKIDVTDLREVIAKNICELRCEMNMTQLMLAEVLNYSDKAVSKWERGEALPDVTVLKRIADYFGVTVDYLLESEHGTNAHPTRELVKQRRRNRAVITLMSVACAWLVATIAFAVLLSVQTAFAPWLVFVYAIPVSMIVAVVFNSIWGARRLNFFIVSTMLWGLLLSVYLTVKLVALANIWVLFIVGIPIQFLVIFLPGTGLFKYRGK